jgi:hypothetical protein
MAGTPHGQVARRHYLSRAVDFRSDDLGTRPNPFSFETVLGLLPIEDDVQNLSRK